MKVIITVLLSATSTLCALAQPWKNPLMIARSSDGITLGAPSIFQDSSGVPSLIRWNGDTLIAAFQWFRLPNPSPSWDRVAVKFSYDNGQSWTPPAPIVISGMPAGYQRPFDPTLIRLNSDSIRIYFSSSNGAVPPGADSIINTHSARSNDGIHYDFEPGARVDVDTNRVIDPAVINFNGLWHYLAPAGAPQQGAYHYISSDGLSFNAVPKIMSDPLHNWTGNYMIESNTELRFYGSSPANIWYNSSSNGGVWIGYVSTNIVGGDPAVLKLAANSYQMIYTGQPYGTGVPFSERKGLSIYPNPAGDQIAISGGGSGLKYAIVDLTGRTLVAGITEQNTASIDLSGLKVGVYLLRIEGVAAVWRFSRY
jgi:hypothetical protein